MFGIYLKPNWVWRPESRWSSPAAGMTQTQDKVLKSLSASNTMKIALSANTPRPTGGGLDRPRPSRRARSR
ncbi:hypothetical protein GCM10010276_83670 [Streptomyces longisporus]|uniref:Uncharacterized protein n=1 Tax=Streptomyces longisporus TaxID=1948 RepID=A0ABP6AQ17_STRLO